MAGEWYELVTILVGILRAVRSRISKEEEEISVSRNKKGTRVLNKESEISKFDRNLHLLSSPIFQLGRNIRLFHHSMSLSEFRNTAATLTNYLHEISVLNAVQSYNMRMRNRKLSQQCVDKGSVDNTNQSGSILKVVCGRNCEMGSESNHGIISAEERLTVHNREWEWEWEALTLANERMVTVAMYNAVAELYRGIGE